MHAWKMIRNFVSPVLDYAHVDFSQVAYVNLLKWRTRKSSGLARLYGLSWQHHTREQIPLLEAKRDSRHWERCGQGLPSPITVKRAQRIPTAP